MTSTGSGTRPGLHALHLRQAYRVARQDWPKLSLLRDRNVHAHIVTMQQSGTHWLTHMLAAALSEVFDLPQLNDIDDRRIIGDHKRPAVHAELPRIIQTHNIPSPVCHAWPLRSVLRFPRYLILLRDIRSSLVSHYEKHHASQMPFCDYLRNSRIIGNPVRWDVWYRVRFLNAWDRETRRLPQSQTLVMHYERIQQQPLEELRRAWTFLQLPTVEAGVLERAVAGSTKEGMAKKESQEKAARVIRQSTRSPLEWFSEGDREYLGWLCSRFVRNTFGYDYADWSTVGPRSVVNVRAA